MKRETTKMLTLSERELEAVAGGLVRLRSLVSETTDPWPVTLTNSNDTTTHVLVRHKR